MGCPSVFVLNKVPPSSRRKETQKTVSLRSITWTTYLCAFLHVTGCTVPCVVARFGLPYSDGDTSRSFYWDQYRAGIRVTGRRPGGHFALANENPFGAEDRINMLVTHEGTDGSTHRSSKLHQRMTKVRVTPCRRTVASDVLNWFITHAYVYSPITVFR